MQWFHHINNSAGGSGASVWATIWCPGMSMRYFMAFQCNSNWSDKIWRTQTQQWQVVQTIDKKQEKKQTVTIFPLPSIVAGLYVRVAPIRSWRRRSRRRQRRSLQIFQTSSKQEMKTIWCPGMSMRYFMAFQCISNWSDKIWRTQTQQWQVVQTIDKKQEKNRVSPSFRCHQLLLASTWELLRSGADGAAAGAVKGGACKSFKHLPSRRWRPFGVRQQVCKVTKIWTNMNKQPKRSVYKMDGVWPLDQSNPFFFPIQPFYIFPFCKPSRWEWEGTERPFRSELGGNQVPSIEHDASAETFFPKTKPLANDWRHGRHS